MSLWIKAVYQSAIPSRFSGLVALAVAGVGWVLVALLLGFGAIESELGIASFFLLTGLMVLPAAALLLGLGALFNRRWTARGLQLGAVTLLLVVAWVFMSIGGSAEQTLGDALVVSTVFLFLPLALSGLLTAVHAVGSVFEVRVELDRIRTEWLTHALDLRGWLDADEIAANTGWDLGRAEQCADGAGFDATVEGRRLRLDRVAARHRERILAMVQTRGTLPLAELEQVLQEPREALAVRLAELRESGDLHGYLRDDVLYSSDLAKLRALGRCPACDGTLDLKGLGLVACGNCSTVVYL